MEQTRNMINDKIWDCTNSVTRKGVKTAVSIKQCWVWFIREGWSVFLRFYYSEDLYFFKGDGGGWFKHHTLKTKKMVYWYYKYIIRMTSFCHWGTYSSLEFIG